MQDKRLIFLGLLRDRVKYDPELDALLYYYKGKFVTIDEHPELAKMPIKQWVENTIN